MKALENRVFTIGKEHLQKVQKYFDKYGGFTIVIARFIPYIRSFAPFFAGVGKMHYHRFLTYNIIGGVLWVCLFLTGGFLLGNMPIVRQNFSLLTDVIIAISILALVSIFIKLLRSSVK